MKVNWLYFAAIFLVVSIIAGYAFGLLYPDIPFIGTILGILAATIVTKANWMKSVLFFIVLLIASVVVAILSLPIAFILIFTTGIDAVLAGVLIGGVMKIPIALITAWFIFGRN